MKDIKIYLASADDLQNENLALPELLERLNKVFNKRSINFELIRHNDNMGELQDCELCLTLYHTKFGDYTKEEFESAYESLKKNENPKKIYVFFKNSENLDGEITKELLEFKNSFATSYGHFFCKFQNIDTMKLELLMQLELYNSTSNRILHVEDQKVKADGEEFVNLAEVPFAKLNEDYSKLQNELSKLVNEIQSLRLELENKPGDEELSSKLAEKLKVKNNTEENFTELQNNLLNTALRIAKSQSQRISERMQKAIEAFHQGDVKKANIILDEAENDCENVFQEFLAAQELAEEKRNTLLLSIKELLLKIDTTLADVQINIDTRIEKVKALYEQIVKTAVAIEYDEEEVADILYEYSEFLQNYGFYEEALEVCSALIELSENIYGTEDEFTGAAYQTIANIYYHLEDYYKAGEYTSKVLNYSRSAYGEESAQFATTCNDAGLILVATGDYHNALKMYNKSLEIYEKIKDTEYVDVLGIYCNIGVLYNIVGKFDTALEYMTKALLGFEEAYKEDHDKTAVAYINIANIYLDMEQAEKALEYSLKATTMIEKLLGSEYPELADYYMTISSAYKDLGDNDKSDEFLRKAQAIDEDAKPIEEVESAMKCYNLANFFYEEGDYNKALEFYEKLTQITLEEFGEAYHGTFKNYYYLASTYYKLNEIEKADEYLKLYNKNLKKYGSQVAEVGGKEILEVADLRYEILREKWRKKKKEFFNKFSLSNLFKKFFSK